MVARFAARLMDRIAFAIDILATASFIGFFLAVVAQIVYRYFGVSMVFSEELARLLNLYAVFLGAVVASRLDAHIRIDAIDNVLGLSHRPRLRATLHIVYQVTAAVFLSVFAIGATRLVGANWDIPLATMDWLNNGHIYLAAAIGAWLMVVLAVGRIIEIAGAPAATRLPQAGSAPT
ncbi:MAG: TRAP transporter small permease subunit [Lautropia sp.]